MLLCPICNTLSIGKGSTLRVDNANILRHWILTGLTSMRFWPFFVATGIGQLPATLIYSYVGGMLTGGAQLLVTGLLVLFALSVLVALLRRVYVRQKQAAA